MIVVLEGVYNSQRIDTKFQKTATFSGWKILMTIIYFGLNIYSNYFQIEPLGYRGFLNSRTLGRWDGINTCCGSCLMHCKMLGQIYGFYPLDISSTPSLTHDNQNVSRHWQLSPMGQYYPRLRTGTVAFSSLFHGGDSTLREDSPVGLEFVILSFLFVTLYSSSVTSALQWCPVSVFAPCFLFLLPINLVITYVWWTK